jgi:hypothetical protein
VIDQKRNKFDAYSLETFDCVKMENCFEIAREMFKFYAEEKPLTKFEFNAYFTSCCARKFQDQ